MSKPVCRESAVKCTDNQTISSNSAKFMFWSKMDRSGVSSWGGAIRTLVDNVIWHTRANSCYFKYETEFYIQDHIVSATKSNSGANCPMLFLRMTALLIAAPQHRITGFFALFWPPGGHRHARV